MIYSVSRKAALLSASLLVAALPTVQRASSPAMGVEHAPAAGVSASALASSHAVPQLKWGPRKQLEQPQGNPTDVACPSPVFCLAVDSFGNYTIFNGVKWSTPVHKLLSIGNAFAYYISCATVTFCAAVGSTGYAYTFDGKTWSKPQRVDTIRFDYVNAVSCTRSNFCIAVTSKGYAIAFNGSSWHSPTLAVRNGDLVSVSCSSRTFCAAVSLLGYAYTFNGTKWIGRTYLDPGGELDAVSCPSAAFCVASNPDSAIAA